jgi:hypothetical protein
VLRFSPRAGRAYFIERLDALGPTNAWITLVGNLSGTTPITFYDPLAPTAALYRLRATRAQ